MPSNSSPSPFPTHPPAPAPTGIDVIAFDADDTLWHTESLFALTQERFRELLAPYGDGDWSERRLFETEVRNLALFGYGIKGFTLSMIETAIELGDGQVRGDEIAEILAAGRAMLEAPVELLPGVRRTLYELSRRYRLWLITKGDLFDQESKVARSGVAGRFEQIDVLSEKTPESYRRLLADRSVAPERFLMVGNSLRSDVLPVAELGGHAVHIPYHLTWEHETVSDERTSGGGYAVLGAIAELPGWLAGAKMEAAAD
jgi:putative hydrolase of the HAD superfamily